MLVTESSIYSQLIYKCSRILVSDKVKLQGQWDGWEGKGDCCTDVVNWGGFLDQGKRGEESHSTHVSHAVIVLLMNLKFQCIDNNRLRCDRLVFVHMQACTLVTLTSRLLLLSSELPAGTFLFPNFFLTLMLFKIKQTNRQKKKPSFKKSSQVSSSEKKKPHIFVFWVWYISQ